MLLFDLGTWRAFPATRGRFMQSPVGGPRFEPATLWTTSLHYIIFVYVYLPLVLEGLGDKFSIGLVCYSLYFNSTLCYM